MNKNQTSFLHLAKYVIVVLMLVFSYPTSAQALKSVYNDSNTVDLFLDQGPFPGEQEMKLVIYRDYSVLYQLEYTAGDHWKYYSDQDIRPGRIYEYLVKYYVRDTNGQWVQAGMSDTIKVDSTYTRGTLYNGSDNPFKRSPISWSGRVNLARVTVAQGTLTINEGCEVTLNANLIVGTQILDTGEYDGHISAKNVIFKRGENVDSPQVLLRYQYAPSHNPPIADSQFIEVDYRISEEGDLIKARGLTFTNGNLLMEAPNGTITDVTVDGDIIIGLRWGKRTTCILQNSACDHIDIFSQGNTIKNTTCNTMMLHEEASENEIRDSTFKTLTIYGSNNLISGNEVVEKPFPATSDPGASDVARGIKVYGSQNSIKGNKFLALYYALTLERETSDNIVKENIFKTAGLALSAESGTRENQIYNNVFQGRPEGYSTGWDKSGENSWNTIKHAGKNIVGGDFLGGNYWGDYSGPDENEDGLGDNSYSIGGISGAVDRWPLVSPGLLDMSAGKFNPEKALLAPQGRAFIATQVKLALQPDVLSSTEVTTMTFTFKGSSDLIHLLYQPRLYREPVSGSGGEHFVASGEQVGDQFIFAMKEKIAPGEEALFNLRYSLKYTDGYIEGEAITTRQADCFPNSGAEVNNCQAVFGAAISADDIQCTNAEAIGGIVIGSVIPRNSLYVSYFDSAKSASRGKIFEPSTLQTLAQWDVYDYMCDQGNTNLHLPLDGPSGKAHIWIKSQDKIHYLSKFGNVPSFRIIDCLEREDAGSSAPIAEALDVFFDEGAGKLFWAQGRIIENPYEDSCLTYDGDIFMEVAAAEGGLDEFTTNIIFPLREHYPEEAVITDSFELMDQGYQAKVRIISHGSALAVAGLIGGGPKVKVDRRRILVDYQAFYLNRPTPPELFLDVDGAVVNLSWTSVNDANGYTLFYAPYPQAEYIGQINMLQKTALNAHPSYGNAWYVAVKAYNDAGFSEYSNIVHFVVDPPFRARR